VQQDRPVGGEVIRATLESYTDLTPEAIDALGPQERHRVYRMVGMEAHLTADVSCEPGGDVMNLFRMEISSS
jgi:hypothetical protein